MTLGRISHRMKSILLMRNGAFNPRGSPCPKSGFFKHAQKKSGETFNRPPIPLKKPAKKSIKRAPKFPFKHPSSNGKVFCKFLIFLLWKWFGNILFHGNLGEPLLA